MRVLATLGRASQVGETLLLERLPAQLLEVTMRRPRLLAQGFAGLLAPTLGADTQQPNVPSPNKHAALPALSGDPERVAWLFPVFFLLEECRAAGESQG